VAAHTASTGLPGKQREAKPAEIRRPRLFRHPTSSPGGGGGARTTRRPLTAGGKDENDIVRPSATRHSNNGSSRTARCRHGSRGHDDRRVPRTELPLFPNAEAANKAGACASRGHDPLPSATLTPRPALWISVRPGAGPRRQIAAGGPAARAARHRGFPRGDWKIFALLRPSFGPDRPGPNLRAAALATVKPPWPDAISALTSNSRMGKRSDRIPRRECFDPNTRGAGCGHEVSRPGGIRINHRLNTDNIGDKDSILLC